MKQITIIAAIAAAVGIATPAHAEKRCGWISNTMPSDFTLSDRDGGWKIATIEWQADGFEAMPSTDKGDTCGCVTGDTDKATHRFTRITGGNLLPTKICNADKSLKF
ncbi:DUF4087 domain-containing protein [Paraburkholderia sediminicola]|uniref:DUF4087 domain-containing protein n=1 Tax=Paraburkholderia sediminicola TaxID=458836 RepID=UPI0038B9BD9E